MLQIRHKCWSEILTLLSLLGGCPAEFGACKFLDHDSMRSVQVIFRPCWIWSVQVSHPCVDLERASFSSMLNFECARFSPIANVVCARFSSIIHFHSRLSQHHFHFNSFHSPLNRSLSISFDFTPFHFIRTPCRSTSLNVALFQFISFHYISLHLINFSLHLHSVRTIQTCPNISKSVVIRHGGDSGTR